MAQSIASDFLCFLKKCRISEVYRQNLLITLLYEEKQEGRTSVAQTIL